MVETWYKAACPVCQTTNWVPPPHSSGDPEADGFTCLHCHEDILFGDDLQPVGESSGFIMRPGLTKPF